MSAIQHFLFEFLQVILASAPPLLVGLFLAGFVQTFLSVKLVERYLRTPGPASVARASLMGMPLPLCSCSVLPVGVALRRQGASKGAMSSFLVSTPEIGIDSFLLSARLLGPLLAVIRMVSALITAFVTGVAIDAACEQEESGRAISSPASKIGCCTEKSCCSREEIQPVQPQSRRMVGRIVEAARYGYGTLLEDLAGYLFLGVLIAAVVSAFVPDEMLTAEALGKNTSLIVFFLLSIPSYICAASSTPVAAALLGKGVSAGAVLVFLLAGPATNLPSMSVLRAELGGKGFAVYLLCVVGTTLAAGWLVGEFLPHGGFGGASGHIHYGGGSFEIAASMIFSFLWLRAMFKKLRLMPAVSGAPTQREAAPKARF